MNSRVRWVGIAVLALLTVASACLAAEPAPDSAAGGGLTRTAVVTMADTRGDHPGYGGVGGQIGAGKIVSAGDYSEFAQPRFSFAATWRYTFAKSWRWQVSPGFFWSAYAKKSNPAPFTDINFPADPYKDRYLTLVTPVSTELQWVHHGRLTWHVGAGPGLYRVWVENHRKVVSDPVTFRPHRGVYPGGTAEIGVEQFSKTLTTTSVEITLDGHYVAAKRDQQFPSGFNDSLMGIGLRVGVNYYFNLRAQPKKQQPALPEIAK